MDVGPYAYGMFTALHNHISVLECMLHADVYASSLVRVDACLSTHPVVFSRHTWSLRWMKLDRGGLSVGESSLVTRQGHMKVSLFVLWHDILHKLIVSSLECAVMFDFWCTLPHFSNSTVVP